MKQCASEFKPDDIIKHFKNHPSVNKVLSRKNLSALDVGCRVPCPLFVLYHDFNFKNLVGIEINSEAKAVADFIKEAKLDDTISKSAFDIYTNHLKFDEEGILAGQCLLNETDFKKHFKTLFNLHADYYFTSVKEKIPFDYIILSNVLHLNHEPNATNILNGAIENLKPEGLIYVKVNHCQNPTAKKIHHRTYKEREFKKLFVDFEEILFCKKMNEDSVGIKSMIYFGIKK